MAHQNNSCLYRVDCVLSHKKLLMLVVAVVSVMYTLCTVSTLDPMSPLKI